ncbi:MAG: chaperone modulator CbpM [Desulfovibrionaceae bacterium]|nr:chaperone modulator CbpM [Desulfovibrionaceae bacterium]
MNIVQKNDNLPRHSRYLADTEFVELTGIQPARLDELLEMDWVRPRRTEQNVCLFCNSDVYRVRKLERICCDFELPAVGGAIIVDLLDRIASLEQRVEHLRQMCGR